MEHDSTAIAHFITGRQSIKKGRGGGVSHSRPKNVERHQIVFPMVLHRLKIVSSVWSIKIKGRWQLQFKEVVSLSYQRLRSVESDRSSKHCC